MKRIIQDYYCLFLYVFDGKYWGIQPVYITTEIRNLQPIIGKDYCIRLQEEYLCAAEEGYLLDEDIYVNGRMYTALKIAVEDTCKSMYMFSRHIKRLKDATHNVYFDWKDVYGQLMSWRDHSICEEDKVRVYDQYKKVKEDLIKEDRGISVVNLELTGKKICGRFLKIDFSPCVCN